MKTLLKSLLLLVTSTFILMSVDLYHESLEPIGSEGEMVKWYSSLGLRNGALVLSSSDSGVNEGWVAEWHKPAFCWLPFYLGAGPEGGGIVLAVWFFVPLLAAVIYLFRKLIAPPARPAE